MLAVKRRPLPGRPRGRRPGPGGCAAGQPVPVPPCGVRSRSGALPVPGVVGAGGCGDRAAAEGSVAGSGITGAAFASRPEAVRDLPPPPPLRFPGRLLTKPAGVIVRIQRTCLPRLWGAGCSANSSCSALNPGWVKCSGFCYGIKKKKKTSKAVFPYLPFTKYYF